MTTQVRPYKQSSAPSIGSERTYLMGELRKIEQSISQIVEALKNLDQRVTALEP